MKSRMYLRPSAPDAHRLTVRAALAGLGLCLLGGGAVAGGGIHAYQIRVNPRRPAAIQVRLVLARVPGPEIRLALAARGKRAGWRGPTFASPVKGFTAVNPRGKLLPCAAAGTGSWTVQPQGASPITITYEVTPWSAGRTGREAMLFRPAEILLYPTGLESGPARIRFVLPKGWSVATGLKAGKAPAAFEAPTLAALLDSPALLGRLHETPFKVKGVPFSLVFQERPRFDPHAIAACLRKMAQYEFEVFDVKPFDRYAFLVLLGNDRQWYRASEHVNSSVYVLPRRSFGCADRSGKLCLLFARQLVKAWTARFIHPADREGDGLGRPSRSRARWFTRGVTEYYAVRTLVKTGLATEAQFFEAVARHLRTVEAHPDYGRISIARTSWEAGTGGYHRGRRHHLSCTSSGFLLGLLLDLEIREATRGRKSLDDVMKFLGWWFGKRGTGYNDNVDLEKAVSTVAEHDFAPFFSRHVEGSSRLPVEETLARIGYEVVRVARRTPCRIQFIRHLARAGVQPPAGRIRSLAADNCLRAAGLRPGDRVIRILGIALRDVKDLNALARALFRQWRHEKKQGDRRDRALPIPVTYRRNGKVLKTQVAIPTSSRSTVTIRPAPGRKAPRPAYLKHWLAAR